MSARQNKVSRDLCLLELKVVFFCSEPLTFDSIYSDSSNIPKEAVLPRWSYILGGVPFDIRILETAVHYLVSSLSSSWVGSTVVLRNSLVSLLQ